MEYNYREIEQKWRKFWSEHHTYRVVEDKNRPKFYVLDMFPYPSGAGLHVGHPLGYIASDIYSRYKKLSGYNVLHPMGYDSFGLPAEQYAIETGQHPAITTSNNIQRYREQLDQLGFCYDWEREVRTSSPDYYKWTQWIFKLIFNHYFNNQLNKAMPIEHLVAQFEQFGNLEVKAENDCEITFDAAQWKSFSEKEKSDILQQYRLAYLADSWVNWCPALGTVLANDEVVNGLSVRGNHPVEQKKMRQWSMRITAYAERLLQGLEELDWSEAIKDMQRHWIGKSKGASVQFKVKGFEDRIEVFTTRPDTIFGVNFLTLAPEHPLVKEIVGTEQREEVESYIKATAKKTERERQSEVKKISGVFTGAYALHPFTGEELPIWIGDYVLASYGTGAVMAVPAGDQRDFDFARHFDLDITPLFQNIDIHDGACEDKSIPLINSDFLNGKCGKDALELAITRIEEGGFGKGKTQYRLRDAIFSRQRYWGEPFPVYYENDIPKVLEDSALPLVLPEVDAYLPTETGEPPLARAKHSDWNVSRGDRMEYNTMPGWAGSSWYFVRYIDPQNPNEFCDKDKLAYWQNVDLYMGGAEHATGHLLYSRFWSHFLHDAGFLPFCEPFKKMINQGMILGRSSFVYRIVNSNRFVTFSKKDEFETQALHVDISLVDNDILNLEAFKNWRAEYADAEFILEENGSYVCGHEVEKMSKSKYNVQTPDELVEKFGADTLRMYEMFLGPVEQSKPWDTKGINGVNNFLRKLWRLFHDAENNWAVEQGLPKPEELKILHKTIKKMTDDLERFSFNTGVSNLMICVNELTEIQCRNHQVLQDLVLLLCPYAPHLAEELWAKLGNEPGTVSSGAFPVYKPEYVAESHFDYPVSFNGKMRFKLTLDLALNAQEVQETVLQHEDTLKWTEGKSPKKVIVVPGKIVNIVL